MKNKKGKKLVVLGAMAALLTLIGVSGSQTYAKYVETFDVPSKSATVAKWGYVVKVDASNLFGSKYELATAPGLAVVSTGDSNLTVQADSNNVQNLVAPGTKGEVVITVEGLAEVDAELSFSALTETFIHLDEYYPMVWDVNVSGNVNYDYDNTSLHAGKLSNVYNALSNVEYHFEAGTKVDLTITLSWVWAFENDCAKVGAARDLISGVADDYLTADEADTYLAILNNGLSIGDYDGSSNRVTRKDISDKYAEALRSTNVSFEFDLTMTQVQNDND